MSLVHLHLLLNHVPVIGAVIALFLLAYAVWRASPEVLRVTLALYVLIGVTAVVVYFTGEPAEDAIERLPGVSDVLLEQHEEIALVATIALGIAGALALVGLLVQRKRVLPRWATRGGVVVGIGLVALLGYTANLGGKIRHSEIRGAGAPAERTAGAATGTAAERDRGEDHD